MIFSMIFPLYTFIAVVFSFGSVYRRSVYHNWFLCLAWVVLFAVFSALLLMDENTFTQNFHMVRRHVVRENLVRSCRITGRNPILHTLIPIQIVQSEFF